MPPTSPRAEAIAKLRSKVERRLNQTHEDRIQQLTARLQSSLQSPFDKAGPGQALGSSQHAMRGDSSAGQVRLTEVFDELLASDQAHRMAQLKEEVTFREREVRHRFQRRGVAGPQQWQGKSTSTRVLHGHNSSKEQSSHAMQPCLMPLVHGG
jgi:hypothetical protein